MNTSWSLGAALVAGGLLTVFVLLAQPGGEVAQGAPRKDDAVPFNAFTTILDNDEDNDAVIIATVPDGQLFTMEFVTATCGGTVIPTEILVGADTNHYLTVTPNETGGTVTEKTLMFASPGTEVAVRVFPTTNDPLLLCNVTITGYLTPQ